MSDAPDDPTAAARTPVGGAAEPSGAQAWRPADPAGSAALGGLTTPDGAPALAARRPWSAWAEARADLRPAVLVAGVLALAGLPLGLLWWALAPRADFTITADGPVVVGRPSQELLAIDDAVFTLLVAGLGLLAGLVGWLVLRRRRGVAQLAAVTIGSGLGGVLAWQLGELLGPGPSQDQLSDVGATVTTSLTLNSLPALAVGPFCAVLVYLVAALFARRDDLGRDGGPVPAPAAPQPLPAPALVDVPRAGRPAD
ncbi:hypothetical protein ACI797_14925 [Geodermatophilus sp. SYSU D00691]